MLAINGLMPNPKMIIITSICTMGCGRAADSWMSKVPRAGELDAFTAL